MNRSTDRRGLSHLYYGPGKGKTTAAIGLVVRAAGRDFTVSVLQFMKGHDEVGERYGELDILHGIESVDVTQFPTRHAGDGEALTADERQTLRRGIDTAAEVGSDPAVDLVVLDEITLTWSLDVVPADELAALVDDRSPGTELVLTGREAPPELVDRAEYVTYMAAVKHPYRQGTTARPGIEY